MENKSLKDLDSLILPFNLDNYASYKPLLEQIGEAKIVLLGEASHGTYEFYSVRQKLSQYLIQEKGFNAIAIEGDWPSTYTANLYIQGKGKVADPLMALKDFSRFPTWMWRNPVIVELLQWLKQYNTNNPAPVHFYGLDLYSLQSAMLEVVNYLSQYDPHLASEAIQRYSCFSHTASNPQEYGALVKYGDKKSCANEVTEQVLELQRIELEQPYSNVKEADELFYAIQNAILVKNAEFYYRALFEANENTWNIRDQHMFESLQNIIRHLENKLTQEAKVIVWAHNSHLGNARATEMGERGELNLGQLVKESYPMNSFALGFTTYTGTVTAASNWGESPHFKAVTPALPESWENFFHTLPYKDFMIFLTRNEEFKEIFSRPKLERAIGVIYRPDTERFSHYFYAKLALQFDAVIHIDITHELKPL
jgi:erythromycin esterase-like protein